MQGQPIDALEAHRAHPDGVGTMRGAGGEDASLLLAPGGLDLGTKTPLDHVEVEEDPDRVEGGDPVEGVFEAAAFE